MDNELRVTRLMANPVGALAPDGERGDIVQVSDDSVSVYLAPREYETTTTEHLRYLIYPRAAQRGDQAG